LLSAKVMDLREKIFLNRKWPRGSRRRRDEGPDRTVAASVCGKIKKQKKKKRRGRRKV